jgi:hypothetical protein
VTTRVARFFLIQHTRTGEKSTYFPQIIPNCHQVSK